MSLHDKIAVTAFLAVLVLIGARIAFLSYRRANPKRRPPQLTGWEDGRAG